MVDGDHSECRCRWVSLWRLCTCQLQSHTLHNPPSVILSDDSCLVHDQPNPAVPVPFMLLYNGLSNVRPRRETVVHGCTLPPSPESTLAPWTRECHALPFCHTQKSTFRRTNLGGPIRGGTRTAFCANGPLQAKQNALSTAYFFCATQPLNGQIRTSLFSCLRLKTATPSFLVLFFHPFVGALGSVNVYTFQCLCFAATPFPLNGRRRPFNNGKCGFAPPPFAGICFLEWSATTIPSLPGQIPLSNTPSLVFFLKPKCCILHWFIFQSPPLSPRFLMFPSNAPHSIFRFHLF